MHSLDYCPNPDCHAEIHWTADRCSVCNQDLGAPNQRLANREHEVNALKQRYQAAVEEASQRGISQELAEFEQHLVSQSQAVINCTAKFLFGFISDNNQLYANYRQQTASATRKAAELSNDRQRCGTEGILYGTMANRIVYAALALNEQGLVSYGVCAMIMRDITMQNKATVLEENSYDFVRRHKILPGDKPPAGYQAHWQNRRLLAVAKLASRIQPNTRDFASLLLTTNGKRNEDEFIEVHIYDNFDKQAIAKLALPRKNPNDAIERALLSGINDYALHHNIACYYYD